MAPIQSPFEKPAEIIAKINSLSQVSLAADEDFTTTIKTTEKSAGTLAAKYKPDIDAFDGLKSSLEQLTKLFNTHLWATRDGATKVASHLDLFVGVMIALVEGVETPEDRDDVVGELNNFAGQKDPLSDKPLEGFPGATKEFSRIWSIAASDAGKIAEVLKNATDIKKTVKELTQALVPVKGGCGKVRDALKEYASKIIS